jgi:hypothetical protein
MMKTRLLIILLACITTRGMTQSNQNEAPFLTKSLSGQTIKSVEAVTAGGNVEVKAVSDGPARIDVYINSWNENGRNRHLSHEEIQKRLDQDYTLTIEVKDNKLTASALPKSDMRDNENNLGISFDIFVPAAVTTELNTSGGNIGLSGLSGVQHFRTSGGNVDVKGVTGKITGKTSGGNIFLSQSNDAIDLRTSGGNIEANHCTGTIKLITSGGNLTLSSLDGTITAETSGGNLEADDIKGALTGSTSGGNLHLSGLSCNLEATDNGGTVEVEMKELKNYVNIDGSSGNVELKLPSGKGIDFKLSADEISTGSLTNFNGSKKEHSLIGKLNGGGTQVNIDAPDGKINVEFR